MDSQHLPELVVLKLYLLLLPFFKVMCGWIILEA